MAIVMRKLYLALRHAGVDEDEASQAAEEVASYENRFAKIEGELLVLKWMIGFNLALCAAILGKMLT